MRSLDFKLKNNIKIIKTTTSEIRFSPCTKSFREENKNEVWKDRKDFQQKGYSVPQGEMRNSAAKGNNEHDFKWPLRLEYSITTLWQFDDYFRCLVCLESKIFICISSRVKISFKFTTSGGVTCDGPWISFLHICVSLQIVQ